MDFSALVPLVFWFVVGCCVGIPAGRALQRRKTRKKFTKAFPESINRANIAAVPPTTWPKGVAYTPRPSSSPSLYLKRSRTDPDATAELRAIPDAE